MIWPYIVTGIESLLLVGLVVRLLWPHADEPQPPVADAEARAGHLDAVAAQCLVSPAYAAAILAVHEPEVTDLLELALEVDDVRPIPGIPGRRADGEAGVS